MPQGNDHFDFDFIVVGSGFGGSVSAHRLTEKGYRVAVMEMGLRWPPEKLPRTSWSLHRWFWRPRLGLRGFFNMRLFRHVTVFHGCAVGGGSITYAGTLLAPPQTVWETGSWAGLTDWKTDMPRHYETAIRMLGVVENQIMGPADYWLRRTAEAGGCENTFYRTQAGIFEMPGIDAGKVVSDPFFGGDGPERSACVGCGGCIMGCRYRAKNTLDLNYLYLAEKHGAKVFPETRVVDVRPLGRKKDGSAGYEVTAVKSTAWLQRHPGRFTSRAVIFAASSLGTMELLFHLRERGSLAHLSQELGKHVRTNSESIIGARIPGSAEDLSQGVAIGCGVYIDQHTHIEAVRYPRGSDAMSFLSTVLTDGRPGSTRILRWLRNMIGSLLRHPLKTLRLFRPWGWAREAVILLCMQSLDREIEMHWQRPWFWPFKKALVSHGEKVPTYIPQANEFAKKFAKLAGGTAMSTLPEIWFDVPGTAHCLGGCVVADSPQHGVVDERHHVFGYKNLYICDGSVVAANLGVNPSLTITAMTERAMSYIPMSSDANWNDIGQASSSRGQTTS